MRAFPSRTGAANRALHSNFLKASTSIGSESGFLLVRQDEKPSEFILQQSLQHAHKVHMWVNGHYQWQFLFPISFSHSSPCLYFPYDPTFHAFRAEVLFPWNIHGFQPLNGSQRLVSVIFQSFSRSALLHCLESFSAMNTVLHWRHQSHPQCSLHILSSHCAF